MDIKGFKVNFYKHSAKFYHIYGVISLVLATIAGWTLSTGANPIVVAGLSFVLILFIAAWIRIWGWYCIHFRYITYFLAWVCSLSRRLWEKWWVKLGILVAAVHLLQWLRYELFFNTGDLLLKNIKTFADGVKTLVITVIFLILYGLIKARKHIHVTEFNDFTGSGDEEVKASVNGLAARILNEINRVSLLLRTIDEIQPEQKFEAVEPCINIRDYGKDLEEIVGAQATVAIDPFLKIPLGQLLNFFSRLTHGPKLQGSLHRDGKELILTAQLKGGKFNGSWSVCSDELEELPLPTLDTEKIIRMTEVLVYKIFAQLGRSGSPRWKAVLYYTRGIKLYRDSVRKKEQEQLNLIKAKDAFSLSIRDDNEFVQCYYNLGIIYRGLGSEEAAEAAFRKALEVESGNYHCYYQLARIFYKKEDYSRAQWFCEQALAICPKDPEHWNLWAYIHYKKWLKVHKDDYENFLDIPRKVIHYRKNATMLAWRALCKALVKGEKIKNHKQTARICIRHLAKATGMRREAKSRALFRQAFFLEPDNNDLFFELGKYFYRKGYAGGKSKKYFMKAHDAFTRVFEDDLEIRDPFSFWTSYLGVNAELYKITGAKRYEQCAYYSYKNFLEGAAKEIQPSAPEPRNKQEEIRETYRITKLEDNIQRAFTALATIEDYLWIGQIKFIDELRTFSSQIKDNRDSSDILAKEKTLLERIFQHFPVGLKENCAWPTAQLKILSAKRLLDTGTDADNDIENAIHRLNDAIRILENENQDELKILELYMHLARGYFKWKKYDQALNWAREAAKRDPYEPQVRQLLVEIHFALKDYSSVLDESAICLNLAPRQTPDIIKKIGNAHKERVNMQDEPDLRKKFVENAIVFFNHALKIIQDKSYPVGAEEEKNTREYIENLGEIHFYLGFFLFKQKKYDPANSHFQISRKIGYKNRRNMMELGWEYIEEKFFNEAEQVFSEADVHETAETTDKNRDVLVALIKLGRAAAHIERAVGFQKEDSRKECLSFLEKAGKRIENIPDSREKRRLKALWHRWQGRFYFKLQKYPEALLEFEESTACTASPAVYYHLAETYLQLPQDQEAANTQSNRRNARDACMLCLKLDARKQYETAVTELLKELSELK